MRSAAARARRSLVTPLVLAVAGLALTATALLYLVTIWTVRAESDAMLHAGVDVEIAALADIYATGGETELIARLRDRLAMRDDGGDAAHYLLADGSGRRIAGDIARWPLLSAENSEARFVTLADGTPAFARATQLAPGLRIVAAREYGGRVRLIGRITLAFLAAGALVVIAATVLAWRAAAALRARVARINAAFRAVEDGDLHHLIAPERADELGDLSGHASRLVSRLGDVIEAQRAVTDQVAHEIRTPLAHLDSRLLRLIERSADPAHADALGAARREARGIAELLDSLLDIAASEARRGDRSGFAPVDLSALATDLAELYADSAEDAGLTLRTDIAPDVLIDGDAMQLMRLVSNLLDNAFKYAGEGGLIVLKVAPGPRVEVCDNGVGVPDAIRERIFDRFARGDAGKGHGLGLALVRAIAERHGLRVRCEDAKPGAAFVLEREDGAW